MRAREGQIKREKKISSEKTEREEACGGAGVGELSETTEKPQSTKLALSPRRPPPSRFFLRGKITQ